MVKKGLTNQFMMILEMGVFNVITIILLSIAYSNTTSVGNVHGSSFLPTSGYELNLYLYIPSMVVLVILYCIFCFIFLKRNFKVASETHWGFIILFIICIALFLMVELFIWSMAGILTIGLFSDFVNELDSFIYSIATIFVVLPIIMIIYSLFKNKKTNNK